MNPYIIAELGCVHVGNMNRAKMLIELAAKTGVNCVKFQKRNPIESVPKAWHNTPHPNQIFAYGKTTLSYRNIAMIAALSIRHPFGI
jgi:sialic acid synthase